ncbi:MAG: hypothetical protein HN350_22065 [Phycisphaerales bacterium]|nr:hypothetical protein [Phycisphaerales bacterium]
MPQGHTQRHDITTLSARISTTVLECLDKSAPSYFDMFDAEGIHPQNAIEDGIYSAVRQWLEDYRDA